MYSRLIAQIPKHTSDTKNFKKINIVTSPLFYDAMTIKQRSSPVHNTRVYFC